MNEVLNILSQVLVSGGIAISEALLPILKNTVFQTVLSGTIVYILGQIIKEFILNPIKSFKKTVGKIDNELKYHENILLNDLPQDIIKESLHVTRRLSCDLESDYKQIPFVKWFKFIPEKKLVSDAATKIIRISNAGGQGKYTERLIKDLDDIRNNLNIPKF